MTVIQTGVSTPGIANVTEYFQLAVALADPAVPDSMGGALIFSESDPGAITGTRKALSPETDADYRLRVGVDVPMDTETFNYTAQNTGKHASVNTTMVPTYSAAGLVTNSGSITTTTTGLTLGTYAMFPLLGASSIFFEFEGSFSAQPTTNSIIDIGGFLRGASTAFAPLDGAYFRLNSAGIFGVINNNGSETTTGAPVDFTAIDGAVSYTNTKKYQFIIKVFPRETEFWINNVLVGTIPTPAGQGQPCMSAALPFSLRHAIVGGAAGGVLQFVLNNYNVSLGGFEIADDLGSITNRMFGSYQGFSSGTMGSLANYANGANPTAAVPTNTTAALGVGLGGQFWETDTLAATTDGIICSYQVPAGTVNVAGKRLKVTGIWFDSYVQAALTGGGYNAQFVLAFGHTAVSLATAEAAATKAPRRVPIGSYSVVAAAAALVQLPRIFMALTNPIYVNPGEFIALVKKKVGTAPSAGVIAYVVGFDYSWE